jgi:GxxExxY protein
LENPYKACLAYELEKHGLMVRREVPVSIVYDGITLDLAYRIDLLVEEQVIVECKAVAKSHPVHEAQLLSHLKLCNLRAGLLINFHVLHLVDRIKRMVNNL